MASEETHQHLQKRIEARRQGRPPVGDPMPSEELVVVARNPAEMQVAQQKLVAWAEHKIQIVMSEVQEAEEGLAIAKESGWETKGFTKMVNSHKERLKYYTKVHAALEAGYVIVPNFDLDIFAIRTTKKKPKSECLHSKWGKPTPDQFENKTDRPQLGDGSYKDPWPELEHSEETRTADGGNSYIVKHAEANAWKEVDFPFKFAKPQILSDTSKAMALKIFDEIGVSPNRRVRNQDPMVVGQIVYKNSQYQDKRLSFLVAWWVEASDLEV